MLESALVSDDETEALFSDDAAVEAMLVFETGLAAVEERLGLIPSGAAAAIRDAASRLAPEQEKLAEGTVASGHPVAALVAQLRSAAGGAGDYVHRGATAQDVVDSALVLRLERLLSLFDRRLARLIETLCQRADQYRMTVMPGRTRFQQAVPITFGLKAANWLLPLVRHRRRLEELTPRLLVVQLGGAAGTLGALGDRGVEVTEALAAELALGVPPAPWHTQRDGLIELAGWLSMLSGSLGKMGQDLALLAQTEVAEARDGSAGGSSTMPHKSNPVRSETLIAIARANAGLVSGMHQAAIQEHERGGPAWTLEQLTLPRMALLTGSSLLHAQAAAEALSCDPERCVRNADEAGRVVLAEAAAFALARHMPITEARPLVSSASRRATESGASLTEALRGETAAEIDWSVFEDLGGFLGSADAFVQRAIDFARGADSQSA